MLWHAVASTCKRAPHRTSPQPARKRSANRFTVNSWELHIKAFSQVYDWRSNSCT